MVFHTRNSLSSSKKAQFFILSAVIIISIIFMISQWIEPYTIPDTSSIAMEEVFFVFNNVKEKVVETVMKSKDCEDLNFNLGEYKTYAEKFASTRTFNLNLNYSIKSPCQDNVRETSFNITLTSRSVLIQSFFKVNATNLMED
ncbi:MAG: hypothetical protein QXG39_05215 [Candidatus Aenigmatarchaeota archaeon]